MGISNFFSSLFGKAKGTMDSVSETVSDVAENANDIATEVAGDLKVKASGLIDDASEKLDEIGVGEKVSEFVDAAKEKLEDASEWVEEKAEDGKEAASNFVDKAEDKIDELRGKKDNFEEAD